MRWKRLAALLLVLVSLIVLLPPEDMPPSWDLFFIGLFILAFGMYARSSFAWWRIERVRRLVLRLLIVVVVCLYGLLGLVLTRAYFHEFLQTPAIADCRSGDAMPLGPIESTRKHGFIAKRDFAGCTFYWHEANTGGN
jgi:hypothetical protein